MNTITIFVSWVPLVLPLCGAVRRALGRLQFFCIWFALCGQSGLWHSECCTNVKMNETCRSHLQDMLWRQRTSVVLYCVAFSRSQLSSGTSQNVGPCALANSAVQTLFGVSVGVMLLLESSISVNRGRHLEVHFWLCSSVGRVTSICAVALQRNTKQKPSTNTTQTPLLCLWRLRGLSGQFKSFTTVAMLLTTTHEFCCFSHSVVDKQRGFT